MKKLISFMMVLMLMFASVATYAEGNTVEEDFIIREAIQFGLPIDEVRTIEKHRWGNGDGETRTKNSSAMGSVTQWGYHVDSIAGIACTGNSTTLNYYFNADELLEGIEYWFGYYSPSVGRANYNEIYRLMCEKYGTPLHDGDGKLFDIRTSAFDSYFFGKQHGSNNTVTYAEWLVEFNDTWVVIDVVLHDMKLKSGDLEFIVGYRSISKEKMAALVIDAADAAAEKKQEQNSDI